VLVVCGFDYVAALASDLANFCVSGMCVPFYVFVYEDCSVSLVSPDALAVYFKACAGFSPELFVLTLFLTYLLFAFPPPFPAVFDFLVASSGFVSPFFPKMGFCQPVPEVFFSVIYVFTPWFFEIFLFFFFAPDFSVFIAALVSAPICSSHFFDIFVFHNSTRE